MIITVSAWHLPHLIPEQVGRRATEAHGLLQLLIKQITPAESETEGERGSKGSALRVGQRERRRRRQIDLLARLRSSLKSVRQAETGRENGDCPVPVTITNVLVAPVPASRCEEITKKEHCSRSSDSLQKRAAVIAAAAAQRHEAEALIGTAARVVQGT